MSTKSIMRLNKKLMDLRKKLGELKSEYKLSLKETQTKGQALCDIFDEIEALENNIEILKKAQTDALPSYEAITGTACGHNPNQSYIKPG